MCRTVIGSILEFSPLAAHPRHENAHNSMHGYCNMDHRNSDSHLQIQGRERIGHATLGAQKCRQTKGRR
jgi:hypothetical protein